MWKLFVEPFSSHLTQLQTNLRKSKMTNVSIINAAVIPESFSGRFEYASSAVDTFDLFCRKYLNISRVFESPGGNNISFAFPSSPRRHVCAIDPRQPNLESRKQFSGHHQITFGAKSQLQRDTVSALKLSDFVLDVAGNTEKIRNASAYGQNNIHSSPIRMLVLDTNDEIDYHVSDVVNVSLSRTCFTQYSSR